MITNKAQEIISTYGQGMAEVALETLLTRARIRQGIINKMEAKYEGGFSSAEKRAELLESLAEQLYPDEAGRTRGYNTKTTEILITSNRQLIMEAKKLRGELNAAKSSYSRAGGKRL